MMRILVVILLLLLAVACYSSGAEDRGVVIRGQCPAEIDVHSRYDRSNWGSHWRLNGLAHEGGIELEWGAPSVAGVMGYVIARHSQDSNGDLVQGSIRIFEVDGMSGGQFLDSDDVDPRTPYTYRVFPVTAGGLGVPTAPLKVWSLPSVRPSAPVNANASYREVVGSWQIGANHDVREPVSGIRVLRRESGEANWQLVHDDISVYQDHSTFFPRLGYDSWTDEDADPDTDYEYAICFGNAAGVGRAAIVNAIREPDYEVVQVGPPRDFRANPDPVTVHWTPLSDAMVVGYELEREPVNADDIYRLHFTTSDRAENYVTFYGGVYSITETKFRVRALTDEGPGYWSEWIAADIADSNVSQEQTPKPEVVTLTATHNRVHMVWDTEDSLDGLKVRYLRRRTGIEEEFRALVHGDWIGLDDFDWERAYSVESVGFTDEYDVRPDTEYEYAVQVKRGDVANPMSDPVSVRTRVNPRLPESRPLPVYDLEALPTSEGMLLTWELPDDPTLKGILLWETLRDHGRISRGPPVVLPPDQTSYLALTRGFLPEPWFYLHEAETFNDNGTQAVRLQRTSAWAPDMLHCRATTEEVVRADIGHHLTVRFRACEETSTHVIRRELTADGFKVSDVNQPCTWQPSEVATNYRGFDHFEGTLKCEYDDTSVKPGMWYVYELTQTLEDGRMFKSHHEILTYPRVDGGG